MNSHGTTYVCTCVCACGDFRKCMVNFGKYVDNTYLNFFKIFSRSVGLELHWKVTVVNDEEERVRFLDILDRNDPVSWKTNLTIWKQ